MMRKPFRGFEHRAARMAAYLVIMALCVAIAAPAAFAWTVTAPVYGVVRIQRSAEDTEAAVWNVYPSSNLPTTAQYGDGSFDSTATGGAFKNAPVTPIRMDADCFQVDYAVTNNSILVAGPDDRAFVLARQAQVISLGANPVSLPITGTVSVASMPSSVSVIGTVAVSSQPSLTVSSMPSLSLAASSMPSASAATTLGGFFGVGQTDASLITLVLPALLGVAMASWSIRLFGGRVNV